MKKTALFLAFTAISLNASAQEVKKIPAPTASKIQAKLGGSLHTMYGFRKQKSGFNRDNYNGKTLNNNAIVNDTRLNVEVTGKGSNGFKYGGFIEMYADASAHYAGNPEEGPAVSRLGKKTFIFAESNYGKVELGGNDAASAQMQISANNIATAAGGINGKATKWISGFTYLNAPTYDDRAFHNHFIKWPSLPFDCDCTGEANKITYFSQKFAGFQLGMSYIPDSDLSGTVAKAQTITRTANNHYSKIVNGGLSYEAKVQDIEFSAAFTGEMGKAKNNTATLARHDLSAWELGAMVKYKGFSLAGSYSDWGKTGTPKDKQSGRKYGASYWTAGVGYAYDKLGTSLTYFNSKRANVYNGDQVVAEAARDRGYNKFELVSLGVEYKLVEGLMPYAELSTFKTKQNTAVKNNKGNIFLAGSKLSF